MSTPEQDFSFLRRLRQEMDLWLKDGLITSEQKEKISARYRVLKEAEEKAGPGKLVTTITVLGSVLTGVGVILFIAANWSEIPRWGKLGIIFSSMIASYGLGFYIRYEKENYPKTGAALILLGTFIFGAGIFLIAQIYHITVHYPNGPLLWGMGVLPLAYLLRFKTILSLALIDILIWLGMESSFHITEMPFSGGPMVFITLFLMAGLSLWATGLVHRGFSHLRTLSVPYVVLGTMVSFSCGYILTFDVFRGRFGSPGLMIFYLGIVCLFLVSEILHLLSKEKEKGWLPESGAMALLMALSVLLCLYYDSASTYERPLSGAVNVFTLASNLIFAVGIIGVIVLGYLRHNSIYINIGLLFFVLDVIARYFDVFWKLLPRSIFFIVGGLILLSGGVFLEKKRRKVLASFNMWETG